MQLAAGQEEVQAGLNEQPIAHPGTAAAKPSSGLGLDPGDMDELHTLVSNGLPVTILP